MRYLSFLLLLVGCSDGPINPTLRIQSGYEKYVTMFEKYSYTTNNHFKVNNLIVTSVPEISGTIIAQCRKYWYPAPKITVSIKIWNTLTETEREMVFLHELGHCLLDRQHYDHLKENGDPISLMAPIIFSPATYLNNKEYYIKELFENKP